MVNYKVGQVLRLSAVFTAANLSAVDPTTVHLDICDPDEEVTKLVYGGGGPTALVQRDSIGHYHYDLVLTKGGQWSYRFWSTGVAQTANEKTFDVDTLLVSDAASTPPVAV